MREDGLPAMEKSIPVPLRVTFKGLSGALSFITNVAARPAIAVGVNVTPTLQLLPAAMICPEQVSDMIWKSATFAPDKLTVLRVSADVPSFVRVVLCTVLVIPSGWLPKSMAAVLSEEMSVIFRMNASVVPRLTD